MKCEHDWQFCGTLFERWERCRKCREIQRQQWDYHGGTIELLPDGKYRAVDPIGTYAVVTTMKRAKWHIDE